METKIIELSKETEKIALKTAVNFLKNGKTLVYPTETCYGIGCKISSKKSIKKVFLAKQRNPEKALAIIVSSKKMIRKYGVLTKKAELLMEKFMPGALTLIIEKKATVPDALSKNGIGFRISGNKFANELCKKLGEPVVSTSANIEGEKEIYSGKKAIAVFNGKIDLIIDCGKLPRNKTSTIFDTRTSKILRNGTITEKEIIDVLWKK